MKTEPKTIYLICLAFMAYFSNSCGLIIKDSWITLEYKFVNTTSKLISMNISGDKYLVKPNTSRTIQIRETKIKEINEGYFLNKPPMTDICRPCVLYYDSQNCDTLKGLGPENRANYDFLKKVDSNNWQLQYTFTDADYQRSKPCN